MSYQRPIFTETNQYSKNNTHKFIPITTTNESTKENPIRIFNKNSFLKKKTMIVITNVVRIRIF